MITRLSVLIGVLFLIDAPALAQESSTDPDETRAIVAEMLADAQTRASLLTAGDAGHDTRFFIAGDGFRLNFGALEQFRYLANFRSNDNTEAFQSGFQHKRLQVWFDGQVDTSWEFRVMGVFASSAAPHFAPKSGVFTLQDAFARYKAEGGLTFTWGQFKPPLLREELVADQYQLAGERSLTNFAFTAYRSQGAMLTCQSEDWRGCAEVSDGLNAPNSDLNTKATTPSFVQAGQAEYAVTGRLECKIGGGWEMFDQFAPVTGQDFGAMLGAAAHWQQSRNSSNPGDVDQDTFQYTADASLKGDSWAVFGAFIGRNTRDRGLIGAGNFNDFGAVLQGAWRFAPKTDVFARWEAIFVDSARVPAGTEHGFHFLTAGFNQYFAGQAARLTLDVVYCFNQTTNLQTLQVLPNTWVGLFGENKRGETVLRGQFQLLF